MKAIGLEGKAKHVTQKRILGPAVYIKQGNPFRQENPKP
jgi:hypothetical protein